MFIDLAKYFKPTALSWCYTTDPLTPKDDCDVPKCFTDCYTKLPTPDIHQTETSFHSCNGDSNDNFFTINPSRLQNTDFCRFNDVYTGEKSIASDGTRCEKWKTHGFYKDVFEENFCRFVEDENAVGCFVGAGDFKSCDVPGCVEILNEFQTPKSCFSFQEIKNEQKSCDDFENGEIYNVTEYNYAFQNSDTSKNYTICSSPMLCEWSHEKTSKKDTPQCYTSNKSRQYRGSVKFSKSGYECINWSQVPFEHKFLDDLWEVNSCADPTGSGVPWCFIRDPNNTSSFVKENCAVPECIVDCPIEHENYYFVDDFYVKKKVKLDNLMRFEETCKNDTFCEEKQLVPSSWNFEKDSARFNTLIEIQESDWNSENGYWIGVVYRNGYILNLDGSPIFTGINQLIDSLDNVGVNKSCLAAGINPDTGMFGFYFANCAEEKYAIFNKNWFERGDCDESDCKFEFTDNLQLSFDEATEFCAIDSGSKISHPDDSSLTNYWLPYKFNSYLQKYTNFLSDDSQPEVFDESTPLSNTTDLYKPDTCLYTEISGEINAIPCLTKLNFTCRVSENSKSDAENIFGFKLLNDLKSINVGSNFTVAKFWRNPNLETIVGGSSLQLTVFRENGEWIFNDRFKGMAEFYEKIIELISEVYREGVTENM